MSTPLTDPTTPAPVAQAAEPLQDGTAPEPSAAQGPRRRSSTDDLFADERTSTSISGGTILGVVVFLLAVAGTAFLHFEVQNAEAEKAQIIKEAGAIETSINKLRTGDAVSQQLIAYEIMEKAEKQRVQWSVIAADVLAIEDYNDNQIQFQSFSATPNKQISISGGAKSYENVTNMIDSLVENPKTENPFVSTVSGDKDKERKRGSNTAKDNFPVKFQLTFTLVEPPEEPDSPPETTETASPNPTEQ